MFADYWEIMGDAIEEVAAWEADWAAFEEDMASGDPWAE